MKQTAKYSWVVGITLLSFLVGIFLMQEIQLQHRISAASADSKTEVLVSLITNLEAETTDLENQIIAVRQQTEEVLAHTSSGESRMNELQTQLSQQRIRAGVTELEGPGIVVTVDDNKSGMSTAPAEEANRYVIHYENLLYMVNDLRNAGVDGISINGQRLVATSEIRCVGNVILINTTRLAPPYEISAIGNPAKLQEAIENSTTYQTLALSGFPASYKVTDLHSNEIHLPAYSGSLSTRNLTIDDTDEQEGGN